MISLVLSNSFAIVYVTTAYP